jgi:mono/diheme cytochrome c family protein
MTTRPFALRPGTTMTFIAIVVVLCGFAPAQSDGAAVEHFERHIRPLFATHCADCHGGDAPDADLDLTFRRGGLPSTPAGPVIVAGDPTASRLIKAITYDDSDLRMPPAGKLPDEAVAALTAWVRAGAAIPRGDGIPASAPAPKKITKGEHWAFKPRIATATDSDFIDRAIDAGLTERGLSRREAADRRTWLRRVTFDLTGLPPTIQEIRAYLADTADDADARVVERLLGSSAYGERFARKWLDVARYADSNGVDENLAFADAWRYRDWVVAAMNADLPYDRFIAMQLAGDLIGTPDESDRERRDRLTATGFLALGPKMLAEQDKEKLRMDTVDEQIDVVTKAFLGVTVSCARCHDHKFDPVTAEDYYALAGVFRSTRSFANLDFVSRWHSHDLSSKEERAFRELWEKDHAESKKRLADDTKAARAAALRGRTRAVASARISLANGARGTRIVPASAATTNGILDAAKWGSALHPVVRSDRGKGRHFAEWNVSVERPSLVWIRYAAQEARPVDLLVDGVKLGTRADVATGGWHPKHLGLSEPFTLEPGSHVVRLDRDGHLPHLADLVIVPVSPRMDAAAHEATALAALTRSDATRAVGPDAPRLAAWIVEGRTWVAAARRPPTRSAWPTDQRTLVEARESAVAALETSKPKPADMAPGVADQDPQDVAVHVRGSHLSLGPTKVPRGPIGLFDDVIPRGPDSPKGSGRKELAAWFADPRHPLTARVAANRAWAAFFGTGLVRTTSNFGLRGEAPTHPELLDALADRLVRSGWSMKALHRVIVLSRTYRQATALVRPEADPDLRYLSGFPRRRLDAEQLRDALLAATGDIDRTLGGSLLDVAEGDYVTNDQSQDKGRYETPRRTLYLPVIRNALFDYLGTFDFGDPSMSQETRTTTIVPAQALWLMNSPFMASRAAAAAKIAADQPDAARLDAVWERLVGRPPSDAERHLSNAYLRRGDWARYVRVVLASDAFIFLD